jgi:ABC-type uncharacterized transport system substrate-binding protein
MAGANPVHPLARAFIHTLRDLGHVEPVSLVVERRSAEGHLDRFRGILTELLRNDVDVLVTVGNPMTRLAKELTSTVPIVMATGASPVEAGLIASLARPGGNVTGVTIDSGPELESKRMEYLHAALPQAHRVAFLAMRAEWEGPWGDNARTAAGKLGLALLPAEHTPPDYAPAFAVINKERPDALFVSGGPHSSPPNYANRKVILEFAMRRRLPALCPVREFAEDGALLSYGVNVATLFRTAARYVDKILKGAKPSDLPVEQARSYELVVNARTAKALGVVIPRSLLLRADHVIE